MRYVNFTYETKVLRPKKTVIDYYLTLNKKEKLTDFEKEDIKRLRQIIRTNMFQVSFKHKKSDIVETVLLNNKPTPKDLKEGFQKVIKKLKEKKLKSREMIKTYKEFYGYKMLLVGGVHQVENTVLTAEQKSTKNSIASYKKPSTDKRYIGVELEFNYRESGDERTDIAEQIAKYKLGKYCNLTTDGSCGHELRILLPEDNFIIPLRKIVNIIKGLNFKVNDKCGLHVHLDMRTRDVNKCYTNLVSVQDLMFKLVPEKRRNNEFCRPNNTTSFREAVEHEGGRRYWYVNHQAYSAHKTLEVRLHQGSLSAVEIINWVKLLLKVVNYDGTLTKSVTNPSDFVSSFGLNKIEQKRLERRFNKYNRSIATTIQNAVSF